MLSDLINESAKLKDTDVTREAPSDRLSKLMLILQWNVRDAAKLVPLNEQVLHSYSYCMYHISSCILEYCVDCCAETSRFVQEFFLPASCIAAAVSL